VQNNYVPVILQAPLLASATILQHELALASCIMNCFQVGDTHLQGQEDSPTGIPGQPLIQLPADLLHQPSANLFSLTKAETKTKIISETEIK